MLKRNRKILIPLSSGLDSTALVYDRIKRGYPIQTCYFRIENNDLKADIEERHRKFIIDQFYKEYPGMVSDLGKTFSTELRTSGLFEMVQPPIWLMGIVSSATEAEVVEIGYTLGDQAISFIPEVKKLYKAYKGFCSNLPKLEFPMVKEPKRYSLLNLPEDVRLLLWSCENPLISINTITTTVYTECGECQACKRAKYDDVFQERTFTYNKKTDKLKINGKTYSRN